MSDTWTLPDLSLIAAFADKFAIVTAIRIVLQPTHAHVSAASPCYQQLPQ
jgi:hypothetical protein